MGKFASALLDRRADTTLRNPAQWLIDWAGGGPTKSGVQVNPDRALQSSAVFACVRVLAETIASTPFIVYQRQTDGSKKRATSNPAYRILHETPNSWQTPSEFKEMLTGHVALRGNAFAVIRSDQRGAIQELVPLHPDRVELFYNSQTERPTLYRYTSAGGSQTDFSPGDILHLRGFSDDGLEGLSLTNVGREPIGLALAGEEHTARIFSNGANIRGVLQTDKSLKKDAYDRLKSQFNDTYSGLRNANKTAILEDGLKWQSVGMTSKDAEFLELRKYQTSDIARLFRVPPHLIGDLEKATFSNIEQQSLEFITYTMLPWFTKWEEALSRALFYPSERSTWFVEALTDNLVRGDIQARYNAYGVGRQNGWLSINDIRNRENMDPIGSDGDVYLAPLNMVPLSKFGQTPPPQPPASSPQSPAAPSQPKGSLEFFKPLLLDAARRIVSKESFFLRKRAKKPDQLEMRSIYLTSEQPIDELLKPILVAAGLNGDHFELLRSRHIHRQTSEILTWFSEDPLIIEKHLDDWAELLPEELCNSWIEYFQKGELWPQPQS